MKTYIGKAKVKDNSNYIYKGLTLDIIGVYEEFKNGSGMGVFADGSRSYKLSLEGKDFQHKTTIIHNNHLENIELFETTILPLDNDECLELIEFTLCFHCNFWDKNQYLQKYIESKRNIKSVLPYIDYNSLYDVDYYYEIPD